MEQNQDSSLFGLSIDPTSKNHLSEAARWAKFLSIVGFIMCGLIVVLGIFASTMLAKMTGQYGRYENEIDMSGAVATTAAITYIIIAVVLFFPYLFLFRFATKMKAALASNDQEVLNGSFQNLKVMFRYVGIITIIGLAFNAIIFLIYFASASSTGF
jgi:hypothetical protein